MVNGDCFMPQLFAIAKAAGYRGYYLMDRI